MTARITSMNGIDIGLYDFDHHNALYYFIVNGDEQIYLRYGGRDADGPETYLDLHSFEMALQLGLQEHKAYKAGKLPRERRPAPYFPRDIPLIREEILTWGRCVECHLVADYQLLQKEFDGMLNPIEDLFRFPDIKAIGIHLDVPRGLIVRKAEGAVARSGMLPGDLIRSIEGRPVHTFGDLQHRYDRVPKTARSLTLSVQRQAQLVELRIDLPDQWWRTDIEHRYLSVDPQLYFEARTLTLEEKEALGYETGGFASRVTRVDSGAKALMLHKLQVGDLIYAVDGTTSDTLTQDLELYIKLNKSAGAYMTFKLLRNGEEMEMDVKTRRWSFRKEEL